MGNMQPDTVTLVEVGPRDGFQFETAVVPTDRKLSVIAGLVAAGYDPLSLWVWASTGNTLGSAVNWALGRYLLHFQDRRWFPVKAAQLERAQTWFRRYGVWSLLLAWTPLVGDAVTVAAGVMRVRFWLFLVLVVLTAAHAIANLIADWHDEKHIHTPADDIDELPD